MDFHDMIEQVKELRDRTGRELTAIIVPDTSHGSAQTARILFFEGKYEPFLECRIQDDCLIPVMSCKIPLAECFQRPVSYVALIENWMDETLLDDLGLPDELRIKKLIERLIS